MPPKERQSAKKGGRISKAEKERLQRDADEQKLKEIEEARIIAEREEQERLERERIEQEKQELLELKDRERREDELNELRRILDENHVAVVLWESECREKAKWDRYMRCDGSPDPSVKTEINTLISLWREDSESQIQLVLEKCALALQLTDELDFLLSDSPEPCILQHYEETLLTLQNLIHFKLDKATEELLKCANSIIDIETGNMQTVIQDVNITLCLWANFSKKSRTKGVQFPEAGLGFELPRPLAMSDVAVRILHTRYDHLSHYSEREQIKNKKTMMAGPVSPITEITLAEQTNNVDGDEATTTNQVEEEQRSVGSQSRKSAVSVSSYKEGRKSSSMPLLGGEESQTENVAEELSSAVAADQNGSTPSPPDPVIDSSDVHIVDLQQYTPLGGVFYFDVFHIPPQSHIVKGWEMRELLDIGLQIFPYPPEESPVQIFTSDRMDESSAVASPPVGVSISLPDSIMFLEEPQVARWDPIGQHWRTDCISETSYDAEARSISFQMNTFYAFTLLQESYINMPFQSWELRPLGQDSALFTITGALFETSITIKGKECMLHMENAKELDHLLGKWMSPSALQKAMKRDGINIFVNEYSDQYVSINSKDPLIEHAVYEQMALMSSAVAFSWSRWNIQCGQEHLVLQACEHLEAGPVSEEAWSLYLLGAQRSQRLKMKEHDDSFSPELAEYSEFHSTFLHMLRQDMSGEGLEKTQQSQYLYTDVVQKLLCATRVFTCA